MTVENHLSKIILNGGGRILNNPSQCQMYVFVVKVMALAAVPIVVLIAMTSSALAKSVQQFNMVGVTRNQFETAVDTVQLVSELQVCSLKYD